MLPNCVGTYLILDKRIIKAKISSPKSESVYWIIIIIKGSEEERKSVARASKYSSRVSKLDGMYAHSKSDVVISYKSAIQPNADITITLNAENKSGEDR